MKPRRVFPIVAILALCLASTPFQAQAQRPFTQSNIAKGSAQSDDQTRLSNLAARNRLFSIAAVLALYLSSTSFQVEAQQSTPQSDNANDTARGRSETQFTDLLAQARPKKRAAFFLVPKSNPANTGASAFSIAPLAAGPNLPVTGGGTLGRLTKWSGFTGSNSVIGDSTIYEDKFGKVGIGTDTPTSKLTVAGMIESIGGGFRFPDGTVQTSSAAGGLFTVAHDANFTGDGTTLSPLGVAVPLTLVGSMKNDGVIKVTNTNGQGTGVIAHGGFAGVIGFGGDDNGFGNGGVGVEAFGSTSLGDLPGKGISTFGGASRTGDGAAGIDARGGVGGVLGSGSGGVGVIARGGEGRGAGKTGGIGIEAFGGSGVGGATNGLAGKLNGNVQVTGTLSKGGGAFKIDHPLDPANKYLSHSFVESPDMMNIYNGNVTTDANGDAVVTLPDYFDALNKDVRYQLTVIGTFAQAIIAEEVAGNRFAIKTSAPNVRVSWQVTGIRHDAFANKNRIPVEEDKPEVERGYYLHPEAFDLPEEKSVLWARDPERMLQLKQRSEEATLVPKQPQDQR
jgi:hypothetical protein